MARTVFAGTLRPGLTSPIPLFVVTESSPEMVAITVNGLPRDVPAGSGLPDVLREMGIHPEETRGVALAINDEIVRRSAWGATTLQPGDRIEVVTARQGG